MIGLQPIPVMTGMDDREGRLILVDGSLVAVIVRLDDPEHGTHVGKWFLEASFSPRHSPAALFDSPDDAAAWVAGQIR